jgi:SAM-dependent methyltransferase
MSLLDEPALLASSAVANNAMNRERQLAGVNSYTRELGFNPADLLAGRSGYGWLDLCCGIGTALVQAAGRLPEADLVGVDLVDAFHPVPPGLPLTLVCDSILSWSPGRAFDLITCVHGLHYVGDKLAALTRAAGWLTATGRLVADLDLAAVDTGEPGNRKLRARLRAAGFTYDARRRQIGRTGPAEVYLPYVYLGAGDRAGPNYTGQPAVRSHYRERG